MKILYTTLQFKPNRGGTEKVIEEYYNYFKKRYPAQVLVTNLINYTPDNNLLSLDDEITRTQVIENNDYFSRKFYWYFYKRLIGPSVCNDLSFPKRFMNNILEINPDIIHASDASHATTYWSIKAAKKLNIPIILNPALHLKMKHKNVRQKVSSFGIPDYIKYNCLNADVLLTYTKTENNALVKLGINKNKCHVIGLGIHSELYVNQDISNFKHKYNLKDNEILILFIGRKNKTKGYNELFNSLKIIDSNIRLIMIGKRRPSYKIPIEFKDKIIDIENASENTKLQALQACDIFCLPSLRESFGIAYLEAWIYKKPIVACNIPTSKEIINVNQDGLLVEQNSQDIAQKLNNLIKNPKLRQKMGENGRKKVLNKYTWSKIMPRVQNIYNNL